jgi:hypothetical protein
VYRASALKATDLEDDDATRETDGETLTEIVDEDVNRFDTLPEGWDRDSVLEFWSSIGGSWDACVEEMTDEFGEKRAKEHCSAVKNEVVRTERWRNRF